ncbi:MAG: hypothetical protein AAGD40_09180, partial [Pseudomonadota bacterium]
MTAVLTLAATATVVAMLLVLAKMPVRAVAFVLALGGGAYVVAGQPRLPSAAAVAPPAPAGNSARQEAARQTLMANPGDVAAWAAFSDTLIADGRSTEAVEGLRLAVRSLPESADLWVQLGSALTAHADGIVTPAARLAYDRAATIAPAHPAPPYFIGLSELQAGSPGTALEVWRPLAGRTPDGAPWQADLERKIAGAEAMLASGRFGPPAANAPATDAPAVIP